MVELIKYCTYLLIASAFISSSNLYGQMTLPTDPEGPCADGYTLYYFDLDGDGYGNPNMPVCNTFKPSNAVHNNLDCDDSDSSIYPGAPEINDGKDNNCDGVVDNGLPPAIPSTISVTQNCGSTTLTRGTPPSGTTWYWQSSSSGTSTSTSSVSVIRSSGSVYYLRARHNTTHFWSTARSVSYSINSASIWYADGDGDGFGDPLVSQTSCTQPAGYVSNSDDQCPDVPGDLNGCPEQNSAPGPTVLSNENYVYTRIYQQPFSVSPANPSMNDVIEQVTYFDGLGRPQQQVAIGGGGDGSDLVTPIVYDSFGRQTRDYLPVPMADGSVGAFRSADMEVAAASYYRLAFPEDFVGMTNSTANPYSEQLLESSPLNRVLKQAAPGEDWLANPHNDTDHTIKYKYTTNAVDEVRMYKVSLTPNFNPSLELSGYYDPAELFLTVTKNENWKPADSVNNTSRQYKDKQGRTILERTYDAEVPHDTYYVYDDYGNLTYVLPPKSEAHLAKPDNIQLNELCYQYKYDHRNRLVEKKIPGKGDATTWESIVYNKLDQPILTQDPNLKQQGQWLFTKYDAFRRVVYTGLMSSSESRDSLQAAADSFSMHYEQRTSGASSIAGTSVYYTNTAYPSSNITALHSIHYYDQYLAASAQAGISLPTTNHYGETLTDRTKTLATVSRIRVLGTPDWITLVRGYDDKGREIWSREKNPYLDSDHLVESKLDFVGKVAESRTTHIKSSVSTIIQDRFSYDHMGRPLTHTQKINNQPEEQIASNHYDDLGRLVAKQVGGAVNGQGLQEVDYRYNVRGWLKNINDPDNLGADLFGFGISYNAPEQGAAPLFNGNIAETAWKTANDHSLRWYSYDYDALSRITAATANSNNYNLSNVSYDKNGNITNLSRKGAINAAASSFGDMDILTYTYDSFSNQLRSVNDAGSASYGFKDASSLSTQYTYDSNGNLTSDANKGITNITYNHLNLPVNVEFNNSSSQVIKYAYDATGVKLSKEIPGKTTQYAGNFIYEDMDGTMNLQFFSHPEGYVSYDNGQFNYVYNYLDHLGNVRLSYTDANQNNSNPVSLQIIQEKNYYPFGLTHQGYNGGTSSLGNDAAKRYGYGGKELQDENISGSILDWYDVSARNYDPALRRWMSVDPLGEEMPEWSPYNFTFNNPIIFVDPDGRYPIYFGTRSYAPFSTFGPDKAWYGDNRGHTLDRGASYRTMVSIMHDTELLTTEAYGGHSRSHTVDGGKDAISPTYVRNRSKGRNIDVHSYGGNDAQFGAPDIDQFTKVTANIEGNIKKDHILHISGTISGDDFPNQESMLYDAKGNTLWLGNFETTGDRESGPVRRLWGSGESNVNISIDVRIKINSDGVFQGVMQGDEMISIDDWNKQFE